MTVVLGDVKQFALKSKVASGQKNLILPLPGQKTSAVWDMVMSALARIVVANGCLNPR